MKPHPDLVRTAVVWLAALATIALTARLGLWQLDRAAQKLAVREAREQRSRAPALVASELPGTVATARAAEHRRVVVSGRWLGEHSIYLDNRPMAARAGFVVVTPLALDDGRVLPVMRGWLARDPFDRTRIAAPRLPAGKVELQGRLALGAPRLFELAPQTPGPIRQNLDLEAYARETRLPLLPWVLVQTEDAAHPLADGLLRQWTEPAIDVRNNYGYAVQWFALSALVGALLLWFQVLRPWRQGRASRSR